MKKIINIFLILSCFLCGCSSQETKTVDEQKEETVELDEQTTLQTPSNCGKLSVDGIHLVNEDGQNVQLKGISTHGIAWYPEYINNDAFQQFRNEWNVNVMRLAMYTHESGGYCTDGNQTSLKQLIKDGVKYATDNDMYVIIDWHVLQDLDPNVYKEQAISFFDEMSNEFKDYNNVLYEICNEPNGGTTWDSIKSYANEIIPVIRNNDPNSVIIVGTPNWSQYVNEAADSPLEYDNILYTLHFYAATHKEDLRNTMTDALEAGLPIIVSEYGICDASGNGSLDLEQANAWVDTMNQYDVSYIAWNLSNKDESSSILSPDCTKTSDFTSEDLSASGSWLYSMLTGVAVEVKEEEKQESNGIQYTCKLKNSWEADGKNYYQYDVTLYSDASVSNWTIEIPMESSFEISDGWNGKYSIDGTNLVISNESYNGDITDSIGDIGFIVTSKVKEES